VARRAQLNPTAHEEIVHPVVANIQAAIYVHPRGYTTSQLPVADASVRFIAIPPVAQSWGRQNAAPNVRAYGILQPMTAISNHLQLSGMPSAVELYRADEFWFSFNSTTDTAVGAYMPGGAFKTMSLNPGLAGETLAYVSVTNTSPLRVNWIQG
jgi:hypothetical protein